MDKNIDFNIGDKVEIINESRYKGCVGIVTAQSDQSVVVKTDEFELGFSKFEVKRI